MLKTSIYYSTSAVARLANYSGGTLRNYVYLTTLTQAERKAKGLQEPPAKMPKPLKNRHNGRLRWPVDKVDAWIAWREREGIQSRVLQ